MSAAERQAAILQRRARDATISVLAAIGSAEVMFLSFAFGASLGPGPLRPLEIVVGSTITFVLGCFGAAGLTRARHRRGAKLVRVVREGRKRHRVVVFDDYLTLGREVIVRESLDSLELEARGIVLRYRDPVHDGPVLRELSGPRDVLEELAKALRPGMRS